MKTRVLVVDDSPQMRGLLTRMIARVHDMELVGAASDVQTAREMIRTLTPDVLTLNANMAKIGGLEFLDRLMRLQPMPVVMVSAQPEASSDTALKALELGAVDFIGKPRGDSEKALAEYAEDLVDKIRAARIAHLRRKTATSTKTFQEASTRPAKVAALGGASANGKILFIGASTGGTEALKVFLMGMPADSPPILIVQHMPESFTASFARRLDSLCAPRIIEAQGEERLETGTVYIAPGHSHMRVKRGVSGYVTELLQSAPVNRHRPSVDVLFDSAAELVGRQAVAVILTGMGKDGARGMLRMRQAGARTFGQDEASCVVYGMPREAFQIGAVEDQVPLDDMARRVLQNLGRI